MSGGGIGGTLGSVLGAALAPETGGLSIAIPALAGAAGAGLGGALTGSKNPLMDAFMGGIGGGLSGAAGLGGELGIGNSAGLFDDAAPSIVQGAASGAAGAINPEVANAMSAAKMAAGALSPSDSGAGAASSGIAGYLGKQNPLNLALAGGSLLSGVQSLLPQKKVDVGQNAASVMATNPGFNGGLPKYSLNNTATPYAGDWYKYGETPQPAMYNAQLQPVQQTPQYRHGGQVKGYAAGGPIAPPMPPAQPGSLQNIPINPLTLNAAHEAGVAVGKHLRKQSPLFTGHGQVSGHGGGQDDAVHAKLSQDEYVIPAEAVAQLGDGSSNDGAKKLDKMVHNIRAHKTSKGAKFPPRAKNPLAYIKGAK